MKYQNKKIEEISILHTHSTLLFDVQIAIIDNANRNLARIVCIFPSKSSIQPKLDGRTDPTNYTYMHIADRGLIYNRSRLSKKRHSHYDNKNSIE